MAKPLWAMSVALVLCAVIPVYSLQNSALNWDAILQSTWQGYKQRFIDCGQLCGGNIGLVFDPTQDYVAVSEGVGYGLLMAALMNDQPTFDRILSAADRVMLNPETNLYHWRADRSGQVINLGDATDADQDIALALIFAQNRTARGDWEEPIIPYGARADLLIDSIYELQIHGGQYVTPGDSWNVTGQEITNPSYFSPAWYRIFDRFQGDNRWQPVIDQLYATLYASEGAPLGLAPDWSQSDGQPAFPYCDTHDRRRENCRYEMAWEAIRVPWRIGLDCILFGETRACEWARRGAAFLNRQYGSAQLAAENASMFTLNGEHAIDFQNEGMVGMWLVGALASGDAPLSNALTRRLIDVFGVHIDEGYFGAVPQNAELYYNQSLAWLGASVAAGYWQPLMQ